MSEERNEALRGTVCPRCGAKLDAATNPHFKRAVPKPGNWSVCMYCAFILRYNDDLTLRKATFKEYEELCVSIPEMASEIVRAQLAVRRLMREKAGTN